MTILGIFAHPDDEVLGCGGTLARMAKEGHRIYLAVLVMRKLKQELKASCACLGIKDYWCGDYSDQQLDTQPFLFMTQKITALITEFQPEMVLDRKSTRLNSSHLKLSRMPSSA